MTEVGRNKINILTMILFGFIVVLMLGMSYEESWESKKLKKIVAEDAEEICKTEGKFRCDGDCEDGFGEDCYFDSTKYNKEDLKPRFHLTAQQRKACFARRSYSTCEPCSNKFELRKNGQLEEVSCEEFIKDIKEKNQSCKGCVHLVHGSCC